MIYDQVKAYQCPDRWSTLMQYGKLKFDDPTFPRFPEHLWFMAWTATQAGWSEIVAAIPQHEKPLSDACPGLATLCPLVAQQLQIANNTGASVVDYGDLKSAELLLNETGMYPYGEVLVHMLLGRG